MRYSNTTALEIEYTENATENAVFWMLPILLLRSTGRIAQRVSIKVERVSIPPFFPTLISGKLDASRQ
jgi:hypothetical protein